MVRLKFRFCLTLKKHRISFNSTMVRLKFITKLPEALSVVFQFHYGSIKIFVINLVYLAHCFNSTMVRLKSSIIFPRTRTKTRFNSTMVRLKQKLPQGQEYTPPFQFHYGSIKIHRPFQTKAVNPCFNSTMVRLKLDRIPPPY